MGLLGPGVIDGGYVIKNGVGTANNSGCVKVMVLQTKLLNS